jgi:hypothetical protein
MLNLLHKKCKLWGVCNVCSIKIRSKHNSNTLLSLLRIFMKQTLGCQMPKNANVICEGSPGAAQVFMWWQYKKLAQFWREEIFTLAIANLSRQHLTTLHKSAYIHRVWRQKKVTFHFKKIIFFDKNLVLIILKWISAIGCFYEILK